MYQLIEGLTEAEKGDAQVKKIRHSWLFAALTVVLGVAVLSSTLAAPSLRIVQSSPTVLQEQSVSGAQAPGQAASTEAAQQAKGAGTGTAAQQAGSSPAPPPDAQQGDGSVSAQTYTGGNRPTLFEVTDTTGGDWMVDYIVDVFSDSVTNGNDAWRDDDIDAALDPAYKGTHTQASGNVVNDVLKDTRLLYPGVEGEYKFTLKNPETFPIEWRLTIQDENLKQIPLKYRILRGGIGYVVGNATDWVPIPTAGIVYPSATGFEKLNRLGTEDFTLEWKWDIDEDDDRDTGLGGESGGALDDPERMPYYRLTFKLESEADFNDTGSDVIPPWQLPALMMPFLLLIPLAGLALIPIAGLAKWLPLIPLAALIPFLPGWVSKLLPGACCSGENCCVDECLCDSKFCKCIPTIHPPEKPPKTGYGWDIASIGLLLAVSSGAALVLGKKRKKDEQSK